MIVTHLLEQGVPDQAVYTRDEDALSSRLGWLNDTDGALALGHHAWLR